MTSISPAASASTIATRSSSVRSGGDSLKKVLVLADVVLVERQVVDRDRRRHLHAALAGDLDRLDRFGTEILAA